MWHDWSRLRRWLISLAVLALLSVLTTAGVAYHLLHVPGLPLPPGVTRRTEKITLTGKPVKVDFYFPRVH